MSLVLVLIGRASPKNRAFQKMEYRLWINRNLERSIQEAGTETYTLELDPNLVRGIYDGYRLLLRGSNLDHLNLYLVPASEVPEAVRRGQLIVQADRLLLPGWDPEDIQAFFSSLFRGNVIEQYDPRRSLYSYVPERYRRAPYFLLFRDLIGRELVYPFYTGDDLTGIETVLGWFGLNPSDHLLRLEDRQGQPMLLNG